MNGAHYIRNKSMSRIQIGDDSAAFRQMVKTQTVQLLPKLNNAQKNFQLTLYEKFDDTFREKGLGEISRVSSIRAKTQR